MTTGTRGSSADSRTSAAKPPVASPFVPNKTLVTNSGLWDKAQDGPATVDNGRHWTQEGDSSLSSDFQFSDQPPDGDDDASYNRFENCPPDGAANTNTGERLDERPPDGAATKKGDGQFDSSPPDGAVIRTNAGQFSSSSSNGVVSPRTSGQFDKIPPDGAVTRTNAGQLNGSPLDEATSPTTVDQLDNSPPAGAAATAGSASPVSLASSRPNRRNWRRKNPLLENKKAVGHPTAPLSPGGKGRCIFQFAF